MITLNIFKGCRGAGEQTRDLFISFILSLAEVPGVARVKK
jgi:hypothetical protein